MKMGLTNAEVQEQIAKGNVNVTQKRNTRTYKQIFQDNLFTYFNLINTILFFLVAITGQWVNGLFYITIIANALIGIAQEVRAKKTLDKLQLLIVANVDTYREGAWSFVPADSLVLKDHIRLENGMQIPADSVLTSGYLEVNESILTGESKALIKKEGDTVLAGTIITSGSAEADVQHVGEQNFSETIMRDARAYKRARSELHSNLKRLIGVISLVLVPIGILLYLVQVYSEGLLWQESILKMVAALVGMIPEGLVVLTSVALAVSVVRLSQHKVLVQDLYSIESLARVDTICLDKTGTITQGTMKVKETVPLEGADMSHIEDVMGSYVRVFSKGNATDMALQEAFPINDHYVEEDVLPFSSDRKYAAVAFHEEGSFYLGASNFLFPQGQTKLEQQLKDFANQGCRVVILAHSVQEKVTETPLPKDLEPIAMIAIRDVLRPNVSEILGYFQKQGVTLKVISGDDPTTVSALAKVAGVPQADRYTDMSKNRYKNTESLVETYSIFGRVLPDQKKAMVQALQKQGHTVAMIGDGVNDVPALKQADVSVAMASGSAAAKDASNIVLLESDFSVMPDIVKEGRRVINNITRASSVYLIKTVFSVLISLSAILFRFPYPFLPVHLTLISTFGVGVPTFLLQMESSFERVTGRFFSKAFRMAIPSALTVLTVAVVCQMLSSVFSYPIENVHLCLLAFTCAIYCVSLVRIYSPATKYRRIVIVAMAICMVLSLIFFAQPLKLSFAWKDLLVLLPGMLVIVPFIFVYQRFYDWMEAHVFPRFTRKSKKVTA